MQRKYTILVLFVLLSAALLSMSVYADQDGNARWCNSDEYGCWVTGEDGGKSYIMFWSEEARAYFMGSKSAPGSLVTVKPNTPGGRFDVEAAPIPPKNYIKEFIALIEKYGETVVGELEYYKTHDVFISKETYEYAVEWYKSHF